MRRDGFPEWLDTATLAWAADYCEAMARVLNTKPVDGAIGADVCAKGLRSAVGRVERPRLTLVRSDG